MLLAINSDTVYEIILKAREFHAQEEVTFPEDDLSVPAEESDPMQVLASHGDDLTYQEMSKAIQDLEPDQQVCLMALMYLGRGDFDASEWEQALTEAGENWEPRNTARQLLSNPQVADYWEEGLSLLGYPCAE